MISALEGQLVSIAPTTLDDIPGLQEAFDEDPETIQYFSLGAKRPSEEWFEDASSKPDRILLTIKDKKSNKIIGTTSLYDFHVDHQSTCIGYTWYSASVRGKKFNKECKYLLLDHLFSSGFERVEFMVDSKNERSRAAVLSIGGTQEGILRHHKKRVDGTFRDTVMFSILKSEWPQKSVELQNKIQEA